MRPAVLYTTAIVGILAILTFVCTQAFPEVIDKILQPITHSWPSSLFPPSAAEQCVESDADQWTFDYKRDGDNQGLSDEQCLSAFPLLYQEVDRAVEYTRKRGNITADDLDLGWRRGGGIVRVLVHNNHVSIVNTRGTERGHRFRYLATLNSLNAAVTSAQDRLPDVEFTYTITDNALENVKEDHITWAYARQENQESLWLMPDFGFWGWPKVGMSSYLDLRATIEERERKRDFMNKTAELIWRGGIPTGDRIREALLRESEGQSWSNVRAIEWHNETDVAEGLISMEDHCDYMYTAMTEGRTWSGRLKFLLNCHSILVSHELHWKEFYHHLLSPSGDSQNYIKVDRHFSDLRSTMDHLLEPSYLQDSRRIADNARSVFREQYLTPAAIACYWRGLIRGWASIQGFEPLLWLEEEDDRSGRSKTTKRGTPFESYVLMEALDWEVPATARKLIVVEEDES